MQIKGVSHRYKPDRKSLEDILQHRLQSLQLCKDVKIHEDL